MLDNFEAVLITIWACASANFNSNYELRPSLCFQRCRIAFYPVKQRRTYFSSLQNPEVAKLNLLV